MIHLVEINENFGKTQWVLSNIVLFFVQYIPYTLPLEVLVAWFYQEVGENLYFIILIEITSWENMIKIWPQ